MSHEKEATLWASLALGEIAIAEAHLIDAQRLRYGGEATAASLSSLFFSIAAMRSARRVLEEADLALGSATKGRRAR